MAWEAMRGGQGSEKAPHETTAMSTGWRGLINCMRLFLG